MAHPQQIYDRERLSLNVARIRRGGDRFEILLKDPDRAIAFRQGQTTDMRDVLQTQQIFSDAKKGLIASENKLAELFATTDPLKVAQIILRKGEIRLTAEYQRGVIEQKKKKIIDFIHINTVDPHTGLPHPVKRIELAMAQAKVHIDPFDTISYQISKIITALQPIIALKIEKLRVAVTISARCAGRAYSTLKGKYVLSKEKWGQDGSIWFELEAPAGLKPDIYNLINKLTTGEAQIEELK